MKKIMSIFTAVVFTPAFGTVFAAEDQSDTEAKDKSTSEQSTTKQQDKEEIAQERIDFGRRRLEIKRF